MSVGSPLLWALFIAGVIVMLALDLGVFHRKAHVVSVKEAGIWSAVWIGLALCFNLGIYMGFGPKVATEFLTGYLVEKSLSVDNIFVFVVIFSALAIPPIHQHRVLFWGILSALVMRAGMIFAGVAMLERFHWLMYVFGAFLVITGIKLALQKDPAIDPEQSRALKIMRKIIPTTSKFDGSKFFTRENGKWLATPLFAALVLVEVTDVIFAVDSIPAIFAITRDPFIVFTSNIFAILGLRSLFFLLAGVIEKFSYLRFGLAAVLAFVGIKMLLLDLYKIPAMTSLAVIASLLGSSMVYSWYKADKTDNPVREGIG